MACGTGARRMATLIFFAVRGKLVPSSSAMTRLRRTLSCFRSATILPRSKIHSSPVIDIHEAHYKMLLSSNQGHQKEPPSKLRTRCSNSNHIPSNWATDGLSRYGDFSQTNNCGASLAAGHSCSIAVSFTTTGTGTRSGSVSFSALVAKARGVGLPTCGRIGSVRCGAIENPLDSKPGANFAFANPLTPVRR
jgi:hypothetical protein